MSSFIENTLNNESMFHDSWADQLNIDDLLVTEMFEAPTAIENQYILMKLGVLMGKKILDLGCGAGEASVYLAIQGARVTSVDVSSKMLFRVSQLAAKWHVTSRITPVFAPAENLPLSDNSYDVVYGNGVLHHVNLSEALKEIHRVLKPGGTAVFIEPLAHNPLLNIYRRIATSVRSPDEKPIKYQQIREFKQYFTKVEHKEFWLTGLSIFVWYYLTGVNPNKDRYWKRIIREGGKLKKQIGICQWVDSYLLRLPFLRPMCWNTVIFAQKKGV